MKLPPGFRFHPTDVELIMYYLKRKIMGKRLLFEAISELNIYKFSPWDLPEQCCYKSKDLEWYFFVPRERKYASGARMNRASETGYWKVTGKDRPIRYDDKPVGSVKTLVFHQGTAPKGKRTDWVIHEYMFDEKDMADTGVPLGSYVLCKVFQKSGPGPKNGAQYGAPFKEEDWEDDEVPTEDNPSNIPSLPVFPENQSCSMVTCMVDPGSASKGPFNELHPSSTLPTVCAMPAALNSSDITPLPALPENLSCSVDTTMADQENESMWPLTESGSSFAKLGSREMPPDEDDDIFHLFDNFTEDPAIFSAGDENNLCLNNLDRGRNVEDAPFIDGNAIYNGLGNLDNFLELDQTTFGVSVTQGADYSHDPLFLQDAPYLELKDLEIPLTHSAETIEAAGLMMGNFCAPHDSDVDMRQLCFGGNSSASSQQVFGQNQLPALPEHYIQEVNYNVTNANQGYNAAYTSDFSSYNQPEDSSYASQNQERGEQQRKFFSSMHAHCASNSLYLGFSIHVKAEVILWVGGCTNDALSAVFGDFSSSLTCQSAVDNQHKRVCGYFCDISLVSICVSSLRFVAQLLLGVDFCSSTVLLRKLETNSSVWSSQPSICFLKLCAIALYLFLPQMCKSPTPCLSLFRFYSFIFSDKLLPY